MIVDVKVSVIVGVGVAVLVAAGTVKVGKSDPDKVSVIVPAVAVMLARSMLALHRSMIPRQ